jgi:hypothetical protein
VASLSPDFLSLIDTQAAAGQAHRLLCITKCDVFYIIVFISDIRYGV